MYIHKHAVLHRVLYPKAHINRFQKKKKKKKEEWGDACEHVASGLRVRECAEGLTWSKAFRGYRNRDSVPLHLTHIF